MNAQISEPRRVITIPPKQGANETLPSRQKRVAAYCRVSTDEEEQQSSYEAQCGYYTDLILSNREWSLAGIYADEGITGTSAKKRPEFLRMIRMCKLGKIDLVLTKSISRFARNTVDCLSYIRLLRAMGIGIYFEKENINTLDADTEIITTFMGAFAQSESESISKNVSWGKRQAMREGKATFHYKHLYGYRKGADGSPEIIPEQATVVENIYNMFLMGSSLRMIRDYLNQEGISYRNGKQWSVSHIRSILTNEKYKGDVLMQKTYVEDCISKKVKKNTGQLPMYLIENNHPAIIRREVFQAVQSELSRRNSVRSPSQKNGQTGQSHYAAKYALSERLVCGECGTLYRRCTWTSGGKKRAVWRCVNRLDHGTKYCYNSPTLREDALQQAIMAAINSAMADKDTFVPMILNAAAEEILPTPSSGKTIGQINERLEQLEEEFHDLLVKAADEGADEYADRFETISDEIRSLKAQREELVRQLRENTAATERLNIVELALKDATHHMTEWDEQMIRMIVHTVKVISAEEIKVYFRDGVEIDQSIL